MARATLTWPGRGAQVVRDDATGLWKFGTRAVAAPGLRAISRHGKPPRRIEEANLLLHAEAMDALRALAATHAGRFRLCYIDPPFNTGNDFADYEDRADEAV